MDVNEIFFIGHNKYGQAGTGQDQHNKKYSQPKQIVFKTFIKQVSCGNHHSALLTIDGLIYTMGSNIHGTLGLGNGGNINYAFKPTLVKDIKDVDQIVSGSYHMCAIRQGELYTWGKGIDGQLGHGNMKNVFVPTKVQALGNDVESVSCGLNHTLVIVNNQSNNNFNGYSFGSGICGQLGCGSNRSFNHPVSIKLPNISFISAGQNHSLFISQGKLYGCGDNSYMQLGQLDHPIMKNKKYIMQPIKLESFSSEQISLINCYNLSVCLKENGRLLIWGGKLKLWPPFEINEEEIFNFKVSNEKVYYINGKNQLVSLAFSETNIGNPSKQIVLSQKNLLDLDCGENHLLVVGDIVAQNQEKNNDCSSLSLWTGESLTLSKKSFTFSQKNIIKNSQDVPQHFKTPINQQMPEFYFTMHLKSGISEEVMSDQNKSKFIERSAEQIRNQSSSQTFKTFENISSSIELESRYPFEVNESNTNRFAQQQQSIVKFKESADQNKTAELRSFGNASNMISQIQTTRFSETRLQKLMQQMEQKTIHLKKNYPMLTNGALRYEKSITKTPSSYIKKEPEKFVMGSEQYNQNNFFDHNPKISQFDDKIPVGLILQQQNFQNLLNQNHQYKDLMKKNLSKHSLSSFYEYKQQQEKTQQNNNRTEMRINETKKKGDEQNIESIFMQLLRKQKEKNSEENLLAKHHDLISQETQQLPIRRKRLSHSCLSSKHTQSSTSRICKQSIRQRLPISFQPMNRSPIQQNKMGVSKISEHSNISGKTNFKKNTELLQISRSNRQLRTKLRQRDLKISQLQQDLSKKDIQMQMLNVKIACQQCGKQSRIEDPFVSR